MARRRKAGDSFVWIIGTALILVGGLLYLRDRGLLHWPQSQPKPADQRARDLVKKYPDAEVFSGPETDKKKV
ncbi:MAG: hypothetical protein EBV83_04485, partial [Verrucomicrobia bacterium]|nr:hypothetical protein [Verrucomicrobiota bacterium]